MTDIKEVQDRIEANMQELTGLAAQDALAREWQGKVRRLQNRLKRDLKRAKAYHAKKNKKDRRLRAKERRRRAQEMRPKPPAFLLWWRKIWQ